MVNILLNHRIGRKVFSLHFSPRKLCDVALDVLRLRQIHDTRNGILDDFLLLVRDTPPIGHIIEYIRRYKVP